MTPLTAAERRTLVYMTNVAIEYEIQAADAAPDESRARRERDAAATVKRFRALRDKLLHPDGRG